MNRENSSEIQLEQSWLKELNPEFQKDYMQNLKSFLKTLPDRFKPGHYFLVFGKNDKILAVVEPVVDQDTLPSLTPEDVVFKAKRVLC